MLLALVSFVVATTALVLVTMGSINGRWPAWRIFVCGALGTIVATSAGYVIHRGLAEQREHDAWRDTHCKRYYHGPVADRGLVDCYACDDGVTRCE